MKVTDAAKQYLEKMFSGQEQELAQTDPEFAERFAILRLTRW